MELSRIEPEIQSKELRRTQEKLEDSQIKYFDFFYYAPVPFLFLDNNFLIKEANQKAFSLLNITRELLPVPFQNYIPKVYRRKYLDFFEKLDQKPDQKCELEIALGSGEIFRALIEATPLRNKELSRSGWYLLITDLKQREAEIVLMSRRRLAWILERTGIGLWVNEIFVGRRYWDYQTRKLFFIKPSEKPTFDLFLRRLHPDDREISRMAVERAIRNQTLYRIDHRAIDPDTYEIRWIRSSGQATYSDDGTPVQFDGISYDITERKRVEQKILESETRLRDSNSRLKYLTNRMEEIREEERAAIARELHDELGQVLTGFRMDLSWLLKQLPSERHDLIHKVQFMKSYIDPSIELIRRISTELRSGILDDLGLVATIEWQLQVFRNRTGVDCEFDSHINESELDPKLKTVFFRIIQESITNIVKYAEATSVRISLVQHDSNLNLIIQDNGKGIRQHDLKKKSSTGIRGMKERLFVYNGKLSIKGEPGKGTVLQVMIPSKKGG